MCAEGCVACCLVNQHVRPKCIDFISQGVRVALRFHDVELHGHDEFCKCGASKIVCGMFLSDVLRSECKAVAKTRVWHTILHKPVCYIWFLFLRKEARGTR